MRRALLIRQHGQLMAMRGLNNMRLGCFEIAVGKWQQC